MRILLIETEAVASTPLTQTLEANRYSLDRANTAQATLDLAAVVEYDLLLLDAQTLNLDSIHLCQILRSQGVQAPILLLTASSSDADVVAGFDAGADDYLQKPYKADVLLARMRTLLRRAQAASSQSGSTYSGLSWGALQLDLKSGRVTVAKQEIALTATEYNLLELFLRHPDRIFSRSAILDRLWNFDDAPTDRAIATYVKDLRKKLKAGGLNEDCIETIYGMGYRLKTAPQSIQPKTAKLFETFRSHFEIQIQVLDRAVTQFDPVTQQAAQNEAHKLVGSMALFGYPEGSKLARSIETLLKHSPDRDRFSELVVALKQAFTKPPTPKILAAQRQILVLDDDTTLTQQLQTESETWGYRLKIATNLTDAQLQLQCAQIDAVLLNLNTAGLSLLQALAQQFPQLPIVVLTQQDSLADRLAASRLGARQFLHKPANTTQIFRAIARVLTGVQSTDAKVLVVDDDPAMLAALSALLTPWGLEVITLSEPQEFWHQLTMIVPDVVLLDLEMPLSGLELCQVVRQDTQWGDLPILVVTAHTDADSLQQAFAAGADDFITKPVLGPELVTRILSRIKRTRRRSDR